MLTAAVDAIKGAKPSLRRTPRSWERCRERVSRAGRNIDAISEVAWLENLAASEHAPGSIRERLRTIIEEEACHPEQVRIV